MRFLFSVSLALSLTIAGALARVVDYDLTVEEQTVSPAGKSVRGLTINGAIPAPVLRFREGDVARITLHNRLRTGSTSLHWHGLLLPNIQDGVPRLTTPLIPAGADHTYQFPLKQSGTYWYHSHTALQEQQGLYGAIVVTPRGGEPLRADRDYVVVVSDWINETPNQVMRSLMRGSDWYAIKKGTAQSITGAMRAGHLKDYWSREWSRMPPMDVSDVAYDAFLINGQRRVAMEARPGERVRLRVINAGAASYFYVNSATGPLTIVSSDGQAVRPIHQERLLMGMGETYDLMVKIPSSGAWEFRATAQDGSGHASAFLGSGEEHPAPAIARLNPYDMSAMMGAALDEMDEPKAGAPEEERPLPPYRRLQSPHSTAFSAKAPRRTLPLHLTGDMTRYVWSINGKTLKEDSTIRVSRGEVLRLELINDSMMHHPMHLHGHFFRLLNEPEKPSAYAPLKHTVDVPPMTRRVIEFAANEHGDWFFHCHLLYHMESGMGRIVSYDDQGPDHQPDIFCDCMPEYWLMMEGSVQSHMTEGSLMWSNAKNDIGFIWEAGWNRDRVDTTEYEANFLWNRYLNPRWSAFAGLRLTNHDEEEDRIFAGVTYTLPLLAKLSLTADTEGDLRLGLAKSFQITSRLSIFAQGEYDTNTRWMWQTGAHYTLTKNLGLIISHDSDYGFGGGIAFRF